MNKEAKELIEEVLQFFLTYRKKILKSFFESAKIEKIDISKLDEKFINFEKIEDKITLKTTLEAISNMISSFSENIETKGGFGALEFAINKYKKEEYKEQYIKEKTQYISKIKNFRKKTLLDENTKEIFNMLEFYLDSNSAIE